MNNDDEHKPKCRSCGALIIWAQTQKGRRIPVDAQPVSDGNMRLEDRGRYKAPLAIVVTGRTEGMELYKSHFATCPQAQQHRRKGH